MSWDARAWLKDGYHAQLGGKFNLAIHEYMLVGHKHTVENHSCLLPTEFGVSLVDISLTLLQ